MYYAFFISWYIAFWVRKKQSSYVKMPVIPKLVSAIFLKVYISLTFWMPHFRPTTVVHRGNIMKIVLLSKWIPPYLIKYGVCKANIQFISLLQTQPACRQSMQCDSTMVRVLGQLLQQSLCRSGRAVDSLLTCWVNEECWGHLWGSLSKLEEAYFDWLRIGEYTNFCWNMTNSLTCLRVEPLYDHFIL